MLRYSFQVAYPFAPIRLEGAVDFSYGTLETAVQDKSAERDLT
jgi:hypothetical protein